MGDISSAATSAVSWGDVVTGTCLVWGNKTGCGKGAMEAMRRCDAIPLHTRTISAKVATAFDGAIVSDARPVEDDEESETNKKES